MSLREEMWKYEQITGESAEHIPIIKLGAFLDGYEMGLKVLEQEPCDDCISREAAIEAVKQAIYNHDSAIMRLTDLPPVTPQPKMGEWLKNGELCKCSRCGSNVLLSAVKLYNYCYRCGCQMKGESDAKR